MDKLILGTVQFGLDYGINHFDGKPSFEKIVTILDYAAKNGIEFLDTAEAYGDAHKIIGNYHKISGNKFKIITKFNPKQPSLSSNIIERIEDHIEKLNIKSIEGYMYHSFGDYLEFFPYHKTDILFLKKTGKLKSIGVSLHSNEELAIVCENPIIDFIQLPFNLLDNYKQRNEALIKAKTVGKEIHVRSVFLQGLFFRNPDSLKGNLAILNKYLKKIHEISDESGHTIEKISLNYVFHQKNIDKVLFGVQSIEQMEDNLKILTSNPETLQHYFEKIDKINVKEVSLLNPSTWQKE